MATASPFEVTPRAPAVLLVADDPDTRFMYKLAFEQGGFRATSAATPRDALRAARVLKPAIIVTEVGPPGRATVFEMMRQLRRTKETRRIPVIAVTGYDLPHRAHTARFQRVLMKPVAPDVLIDSVRTLLTRSALLRARATHLHGRIPRVLERSQRAIDRSTRLAEEHSARLRCPRCGSFLTHSLGRASSGVLFEQYRPCANGCGLFYYDPEARRIVALIE